MRLLSYTDRSRPKKTPSFVLVPSVGLSLASAWPPLVFASFEILPIDLNP